MRYAAAVPRLHPPLWFQRAYDPGRPVLLAWPASLVMVRVGEELAIHARGVLWVPVAGRVAAVRLPGPVEVVSEGEIAVVRGAGHGTVRVAGGALQIDPSPLRRHGRDDVLVRAGALWRGALPDGAARSPRCVPYATGIGVVWADAGWVYRRPALGGVQVVGAIAPGESLRSGPEGAVLVLGPEGFTHAATCRGVLRPLTVPLQNDGAVRMHGDVVAGRPVDDEGFVLLDAGTGALLETVEDGIPLTERLVEPGEDSPAGQALLSCDPALGGGLLAGPGCGVWRLDGPAPERAADLPGAGPCAPAGDRWAQWDDGRVLWFSPTTGRVVARHRASIDEPVAAWGVDGVACFADEHGRIVALDQQGNAHPAPPRPAPPKSVAAGWAALGFEHTCPCGTGHALWSADGLLAWVPADHRAPPEAVDALTPR